MRAKWSAPIRKYWKISEQMMVKYCDLAICDSVNIEKYIHDCYDGKGIKAALKKVEKEVEMLEAKKAKADAKAAEDAKKAEAESVLKKLLAEGMSADEILAKLK